jgi:GT2 family glycosyltransferase/glycosyltransferase involved in cell wall biosynthesis
LSARQRVLVAFASGSEDLVETFLDRLEQVQPGLPLFVVSEFAPPRGVWIPWFLGRTLEQNRARLADALAGREIAWSALILQPRMPYWPMRLAALLQKPGRILVFNENLDHFPLRPRGLPALVRHLAWRTKNLIRWETRPGGWTYTLAWRLRHPSAWARPLAYRRALWAGLRAARRKRGMAVEAVAPRGEELRAGVTVVIPSRNGKDLLTRLLPGLTRELEGIAHEVIVVDNGSGDGTAGWLAERYPEVQVEPNAEPLSFAAAVNRGIGRACFAHLCLLNNDMEVREGFFPALLAAFEQVPDLFCATAQIHFPEGRRREETGKAVMPPECESRDFPVRCDLPVEGENLSPVLYGSGGCSMYDTTKLRSLGGMGEVFVPAYVEDLDLGWRAWQRGWPTVFSADAQVVHHHRTTTEKYFTADELQLAVEVNYLRFLARSLADEALFRKLWRKAVWRLNLLAGGAQGTLVAKAALEAARQAPEWTVAPPAGLQDETRILALGSGDIVCFPGRAGRKQGRPAILVASPYIPFPLSHGGAVRMYNLMRGAARDFDQVLVTFCDHHQTPPAEILELCREVILVRRKGSHLRPMTSRPDVVEEHDTPAFRAALGQALRRHRPDAVQLEFTQLGLYAEEFGDTPTVLVEHDITLDLYAQLVRERGDWETSQQRTRWERFERDVWTKVGCVVAMSRKDAGMVEGARRVEVLANGVDLARFQPASVEPEPGRTLFIGSFAHLPNLMALEFFMRECWPVLRERGAVLHVISGSRPDHYRELYRDRVEVDLDGPGIELEGFVSDVREAYRRATVVIAPLLASAGTNIKILEAMAMGRAIVSTPAGINGLDLNPGEDVVVVQDGAAMTQAILELFEDAGRRRSVEFRARQTVEREFGWDAVAEKQAELYRSLISGRGGARTL